MVNDIQKLHKVIGSLEEQASQIREFTGVLRAINEARAEIETSNATLSLLSVDQKQLIKESYGKFDSLENRLSELDKNVVDLGVVLNRVQRTIGELKILTPDQFELDRDRILLKIEASTTTLSSLSEEQRQLIKESHGKFDDLGKSLSDLGNDIADLAKHQVRIQRTIGELKILSPDQFEHGRDRILLKLAELNFLTPAQYQEGLRTTNESLNTLVAGLTRKIEQTNQAHQASLSTLRKVTALGMLILAVGIAYLAYALR